MTLEINKGIKISVSPQYCGIQKDNHKKEFLFDYLINIQNHSPHTIQLHSGLWKVYDSLNNIKTLEDPIIAKNQPILHNGENHSYMSYCSLSSNSGSMRGYFTIIDIDSKDSFNVEIPTFQLQTESTLN